MDNLQTNTIRISPKRVFKCKQENKMAPRSEVLKDSSGKYHCKTCGGVVEDVTDTETGRSLIQILAL